MSQSIDTARFVVRARRLADLSQRELAERLGVSASTVARMESGERRVSVEVFARVLEVAGLSIAVVDASGQRRTSGELGHEVGGLRRVDLRNRVLAGHRVRA